jgi:hypothetical protein
MRKALDDGFEIGLGEQQRRRDLEVCGFLDARVQLDTHQGVEAELHERAVPIDARALGGAEAQYDRERTADELAQLAEAFLGRGARELRGGGRVLGAQLPEQRRAGCVPGGGRRGVQNARGDVGLGDARELRIGRECSAGSGDRVSLTSRGARRRLCGARRSARLRRPRVQSPRCRSRPSGPRLLITSAAIARSRSGHSPLSADTTAQRRAGFAMAAGSRSHAQRLARAWPASAQRRETLELADREHCAAGNPSLRAERRDLGLAARRERDDDFPAVARLRHEANRAAELRDREHRDRRSRELHAADERISQGGNELLGLRIEQPHRIERVQRDVAMQSVRRGRGDGARAIDRDVTASSAERREWSAVAREVERDVERAPPGEREHVVCDARRSRVRNVRRAVGEQARAHRGAARGGDHRDAEAARQRDGRVPDRAARRVHEQALARAQARNPTQRVLRNGARERERGGLLERGATGLRAGSAALAITRAQARASGGHFVTDTEFERLGDGGDAPARSQTAQRGASGKCSTSRTEAAAPPRCDFLTPARGGRAASRPRTRGLFGIHRELSRARGSGATLAASASGTRRGAHSTPSRRAH